MKPEQKMIMLGPNLDDMGGISKVAKTWQSHHFFEQHRIQYIPTTPASGGNKLLHLFRAVPSFLRAAADASLVYVHTSSGHGFYRKSLFIVLSFLLGKQVLLHVHPCHFHPFVAESKGMKRRAIYAILDKVSCLVVLTEQMKELMGALLPGKKVFVLPNPVSLEMMKASPGPPRQKRHLIFLGAFLKEKGIYDLVDAVELLVGAGETVYLDFFGMRNMEELKDYVQDKGLASCITVNAFITERRVVEELYRHTALVLPSYTEGIPNVVLEAMATRTPVIATAVGGLKEILKEGVNCLTVQVADPVDLSRKILQCLGDEDLRERIADAAYEEVRERYDVPKVKAAFHSIISEVQSDAP